MASAQARRPVPAAGVVLRVPDGRVLFLQRGPGSDEPYTWAFPGGHREPGEDGDETALRELEEETGLAPPVLDPLVPVYETEGYETFLLDVERAVEPRLNDEHVDWQWTWPQLAPEPLHPGVAEMFDGQYLAQDGTWELAQDRGSWKESDHPRQKDGKFGTGGSTESLAFSEFAKSVHRGKPLKQDHGKRFKTDGTHEVKLSDLKLSKPLSKTDARLAHRQLKIAGAAGGQNGYKRAPVLVTVDADGSKTVRVGHDVVAAAKANGWDSVPVITVQQVDTRDALTREAKEAVKQLDGWLDEGKGLVTSEAGGRFVNSPPDHTSDKEYGRPGPMLFVAGVKAMGPGSRGEQKVRDDYFGHWDRLKDAARCTIAVDTLEEVHTMLDKMKASGMVVAQPIKDRYRGKPTAEGYRDINMVVRMPNGHLAEVQVNTKTMLMAKNEAHKHYEVARVIAAKYMRSKLPVDRWPPEDKKAFEAASAAQKAIYEEAYANLGA